MNIMAPQVICKQSGEKLYVGMDFANWLDSGVTISDPVFTYDDSELTITEASVVGSIIKFFVDGGTDGKTYKIQVEVDTSAGEILQADGTLKVRDI